MKPFSTLEPKLVSEARTAETCEDAHFRRRCSHTNMSTFETDEHLQGSAFCLDAVAPSMEG